jgi:hypothetical protein
VPPLTDLPRYGLRLANLEAILQTIAGRRGAVALRRALAEASTFVDSAMETRTRLRAVSSGFPRPVVGADLVSPDGAWIARPDLCWPQVKVAIEYDGASHVSRRRLSADVARREAMERDGRRGALVGDLRAAPGGVRAAGMLGPDTRAARAAGHRPPEDQRRTSVTGPAGATPSIERSRSATKVTRTCRT